VRLRSGIGTCSSMALTTCMPKSLNLASKSSNNVITGGTTRYHKRSYASVYHDESQRRTKARMDARTSIRFTHQRRTFPIPGCSFHTCPSYASWAAACPPAVRGSLRPVSRFSIGWGFAWNIGLICFAKTSSRTSKDGPPSNARISGEVA